MWSEQVVRVKADAEPGDLGVDARVALSCVFIFFEQQNHGSLAHDRATAFDVVRLACPGAKLIVVSHEPERVVLRQVPPRDGVIESARKSDIRLAAADRSKTAPDGCGARFSGAREVGVGALQAPQR